MDVEYLSVAEIAELLRRRSVSSVEITTALLDRISQHNDRLGTFLTVTGDLALLQARKADERLSRGAAGPLTGVPMAVKDIVSTRGVTTTCGSRMLENYVPQYNATVVQLLEDAGAVLLGKTNLDEFAMGSSNENSAFWPVRNPWCETRVPGGSSGGSAATVSAGMSFFALGTDTGGSIRQPASFTGTVGLKPTYGRVSRYGLVAFASSLDQIGPITRTVRDAATVLNAIAGHDPLDPTSSRLPVPNYEAHLDKGVASVRLGVPREYFSDGMEPYVGDSIRSAIDTLRSLGAEVIDVSLPHTNYGLSTYYVISPAEAMANLARYDGVRYGLSQAGDDVWDMFAETRDAGFGAEVKRRILLGAYVLSAGYHDAYYVKAQKVRTLVRQDFDTAFRQVDALIAPTAPSVAFEIGEKVADPLQMYLSDVYTVPANIAGICAVSLPCGFSRGLPIGLQVLGPHFAEETILRVAAAFEQHGGYHDRHPELNGSGT